MSSYCCRRSDLLVATGDLVGAWRLLGELRNESATAAGEARVRLLLAESCVAVAAGGWAIAIPTLVEALTVATRHHLAYLAALTHLHTANVQVNVRQCIVLKLTEENERKLPLM